LNQASIDPASFAGRLLAWWQKNGRHDLPWQIERSPYRVWVSEIMLQQTQVRTAAPYFLRFMARFPTLETLAEAHLDEVLSEWTGLGYYARARNLHTAARRCLTDHGGRLPSDPDRLVALPGIGPSTANAIVAQAWDRKATILDGNVKRVLSRHAAIEGWPGRSSVEKTLWEIADRHTPETRAADYTQAIMDLGAVLCTTRSPDCQACPVSADCAALAKGRVDEFPGKKPRAQRPHKQSQFLVLRDRDNRVLLTRRPPSGIWGGLWCFPHPAPFEEAISSQPRLEIEDIQHEFSHFRLTLQFVHAQTAQASLVRESQESRWCSLPDALRLGVPRPVQRVLQSLIDRGS